MTETQDLGGLSDSDIGDELFLLASRLDSLAGQLLELSVRDCVADSAPILEEVHEVEGRAALLIGETVRRLVEQALDGAGQARRFSG